MAWEEYRNNDMREQEQLDVACALIEDATRDTRVWLQADPSPEERLHVLAIQERLAGLARIVERRRERRVLHRDGWEWSEAVRDVLSLVEKAKGVRGKIVGEGLSRLAGHLPKEFPGKTKLPPPIKPVNTSGGPWPHASTPKATEVPHDPPVYFHSDLWPRTNVILLEAQRKFPLQTQTLELCKHIVSEMTPLFIEAVKAGRMKASDVLREHGGGMEDLLHLLLVHNDPGPHSGWGISNEAYRLGQEVRRYEEWLALAKAIESADADRSRATQVRQQFPQRLLPSQRKRLMEALSAATFVENNAESNAKTAAPSAEVTQELRANKTPAENSDKTAKSPESKSKNGTTVIGRNIDNLRKECGWSFDKLAAKTGIEKKLILRHVNKGTKPTPRILKEYAQAFGKALGRTITAPDLEK